MNSPQIYVNPEVAAVIRLHEDIFTDPFRRLAVRDQLERQADRIVEAHRARKKAVATHITCWHPQLVGHSADEILDSPFTVTDACETMAREYGFRDWDDVQSSGCEPPSFEFEAAVDALLDGDEKTLRRQLEANPKLLRERSSYGHRATLLHYVGCNGVETHRQVVPRNLAQLAHCLLELGADVNATARMYGGGCTTIALLVTSAFPAEAGVTDEVVQVLVDAGAEVERDG